MMPATVFPIAGSFVQPDESSSIMLPLFLKGGACVT